MNKYTAAEFLGGETGLENADKKNGDFCFTLQVFGNALFMRVWKGRKKGRTYFKIGRTYFEFSQTYFFFAPTCPFCTPRKKDTKTCEKPGAFFTPRKMNIHHFHTCEVCRKTHRSHSTITHHAPGAEQVGLIAAHGAAAFQVIKANLRPCTGPFRLACGHILTRTPKRPDYLHGKKVFGCKKLNVTMRTLLFTYIKRSRGKCF